MSSIGSIESIVSDCLTETEAGIPITTTARKSWESRVVKRIMRRGVFGGEKIEATAQRDNEERLGDAVARCNGGPFIQLHRYTFVTCPSLRNMCPILYFWEL